MSRSPARSGKATATKSLKEKWLSMVQSMREKGENEVGGSSTVTPTHSGSGPSLTCRSNSILPASGRSGVCQGSGSLSGEFISESHLKAIGLHGAGVQMGRGFS